MPNTNGERHWSRRIVYGSLWALAFYVVPRFLIGGIVGYLAGSKATNFEAGASAGYWASLNFFNEFGLIILGMQISIFAVLCFYGLLPGVGNYKRPDKTLPNNEPPPPDVYGLGSEPRNEGDTIQS